MNEHTKDITFKIDGPTVVDNNFGLENDMLEKAEKNSEESELTSESNLCKKCLELDFSINSIFTSRSSSTASQFAVVGNQRFQIFSCYDDQGGNVEVSESWNHDFRFNRDLKQLGTIMAIGFSYDCKSFVTSMNMGWVCTWSLEDKVMTNKF